MNRVLSLVLKNKSPHYLLYNEEPGLHVMKYFGTLTYASTLHTHRTKLDHGGRKYIFLGYKQGVKGTVLLDLNNNEIFISRNVVHHQHVFHFKPNWHYLTCDNLTYEPSNIQNSFTPFGNKAKTIILIIFYKRNKQSEVNGESDRRTRTSSKPGAELQWHCCQQQQRWF